jgi:hypothetical protein
MFSQLLERESFCDVTLACEGKTLRAHKVSLDRTYASMLTSEFEVPRWVFLQFYASYTKFYKNHAVSSVLEFGFETCGQADARLDDWVLRKVFLQEQAQKQVHILYSTRLTFSLSKVAQVITLVA